MVLGNGRKIVLSALQFVLRHALVRCAEYQKLPKDLFFTISLFTLIENFVVSFIIFKRIYVNRSEESIGN